MKRIALTLTMILLAGSPAAAQRPSLEGKRACEAVEKDADAGKLDGLSREAFLKRMCAVTEASRYDDGLFCRQAHYILLQIYAVRYANRYDEGVICPRAE